MPRKARRKRRRFGRLRQLPSGRWQAAYTGPDGKLHKAPRTYAADVAAEAGSPASAAKSTSARGERSNAPTASRCATTRSGGSNNDHCGLAPGSCTRHARAADPARAGRREARHADTGSGPHWHTALGTERRPATPTPTRCCTRSARPPYRTKCSTPTRAGSGRRCKPSGAATVDILTPAQVDKLASKMPARLRASVRAGRMVRSAVG